jgi:hypothetical protein
LRAGVAEDSSLFSLEEIRRQARENWLQLRQQMASAAKGAGHFKDADRGTREDQSHSIDNDLDDSARVI